MTTTEQRAADPDPTTGWPPRSSAPRGLDRVRSALGGVGGWETLSFLLIGGVGYVVDVAAFNVLLSVPGLADRHPSVARTLAVVVAMLVTYVGNRCFTWPHSEPGARRREAVLFVVFNVVGLGFSLVCLTVSHDLLGLTGRLADNLSANVVGVGLGTLFRFWAYRRFVFRTPPTGP